MQQISTQPPSDSRTTTVSSVNQNVPSTTESAEYRTCLSNCQTTTEYNPVCGSNGVTYDNRGRLQCATRCGTSEFDKSSKDAPHLCTHLFQEYLCSLWEDVKVFKF